MRITSIEPLTVNLSQTVKLKSLTDALKVPKTNWSQLG